MDRKNTTTTWDRETCPRCDADAGTEWTNFQTPSGEFRSLESCVACAAVVDTMGATA